ncbi:hypothetical protein QR680_004307 [Steinernema hermaphroditum]|uniref:Uncharacterized protein n=1 Tax=Steinernema hermaphroditum TaxID=289476 RepID=A0AA39HNB4_9BILA|nr:hypothetical protein QR680_004307 [Steinernema hermaphroditum]
MPVEVSERRSTINLQSSICLARSLVRSSFSLDCSALLSTVVCSIDAARNKLQQGAKMTTSVIYMYAVLSFLLTVSPWCDYEVYPGKFAPSFNTTQPACGALRITTDVQMIGSFTGTFLVYAYIVRHIYYTGNVVGAVGKHRQEQTEERRRQKHLVAVRPRRQMPSLPGELQGRRFYEHALVQHESCPICRQHIFTATNRTTTRSDPSTSAQQIKLTVAMDSRIANDHVGSMVIAFHILHVHRLILTQFVTHTHHGFSRTDYDRRFRLLYYGLCVTNHWTIFD